MSGLELSGGDVQLRGGVELSEFTTGVVLKIQPELQLSAADLSRFNALTGQALQGAIDLGLEGQANLLGGAFDLRLRGTAADLAIGQPRLDPLLAGDTQLEIDAIRDGMGTRLPMAKLFSDQAEIALSADLKTGAGTVDFSALIKDASSVAPGLSGPLKLAGQAVQSDQSWQLVATGTGPGGADLAVHGIVDTRNGGVGSAKGEVTGKIADLSAFRAVIGQPVSGAMTMTAQLEMDVENGALAVALDGAGRDLSVGNPMLDPLTAGQSKLSLSAHREKDARFVLDNLKLETREINLTATGDSDDGAHRLRFDATLRDLAVLADGVSGSASAQGIATLADDKWQLDIKGQGPNQAAISAAGSVAADGSRGDLVIDGSVHLALLNPMIRPRVLTGKANLDLALKGPLALSSLSGQVQVAGGQLVLPAYNVSLNLDRAVAALAAGGLSWICWQVLPRAGRSPRGDGSACLRRLMPIFK